MAERKWIALRHSSFFPLVLLCLVFHLQDLRNSLPSYKNLHIYGAHSSSRVLHKTGQGLPSLFSVLEPPFSCGFLKILLCCFMRKFPDIREHRGTCAARKVFRRCTLPEKGKRPPISCEEVIILTAEVKKCVDARLNLFEQYYTVPASLQGEVDAFTAAINRLGEASSSAAEFESAFASSPLQQQFNAILPRLSPKPYKMTQEDKANSRRVMKDILREDKEQIVSDAVMDAANTVKIEAESAAISQAREAMIQNGTLDDFTRASNMVQDTKNLFGFLGKKFGKKK